MLMFVTKRHYFFSEFPIRAIHDGKLVKVRPLTAEDDVFGFSSFFLARPFLIFVLMLAAAFGAFMVGLMLVVGLNQTTSSSR